MLILMLLLVVPEALCASVLECTILVGQLNKYSFLSPRPLRYYMNYISGSSKTCTFGVTLSTILRQVFMEAAIKAPASLILSLVGSTFRKHDKA